MVSRQQTSSFSGQVHLPSEHTLIEASLNHMSLLCEVKTRCVSCHPAGSIYGSSFEFDSLSCNLSLCIEPRKAGMAGSSSISSALY